MPIAKFAGGSTVTALTSTNLESSGMIFVGCSTTDDPQQTNYTDIKAGIIGNPGDVGGVTPATSIAADAITTDSIDIGDSTPFSDAAGVLTLQEVDALDATTLVTILAAIQSGTLTLIRDFNEPLFFDEFWTAQRDEWATRVTTGSVAIQSKDNGWIRLTTGAVSTNEESLDWNDICQFANTKRPSFECRLQLEQVTVLEVYVGFVEISSGGEDDYILIGFDAYSQNTWYLEASTAGAATTDMGTVADTNEVKLRFEFTSDTALEWFVDDVSQGTVSSNVPTAQLQPCIMIKTQEAAAHYVDVDYVKITQDRV